MPADADEWSVDPFGGEVRDGYVWGRGAVDMKDMDAMVLAVVRDWARTGRKPPRDIVLAFVADEEAGGRKGAHWLVDNHPDLFADCTEAISEVGGFSVTIGARPAALSDPDRREGHRLAAAGRRRSARPRLDAARRQRRHPAGRGRLADRRLRVPDRASPTPCGGSSRASPRSPVSTSTRTTPGPALPKLGSMARMIGATIRNTANPTMLDAGYKANVIPSRAEAMIDTRFLPGQEDALLATIDELIGDGVTREFDARDIAVETSFDGALVDAMSAALRAEDPARTAAART